MGLMYQTRGIGHNNILIYILLWQGCFSKLLVWIQENVNLVGGIGIGVALFQVRGPRIKMYCS